MNLDKFDDDISKELKKRLQELEVHFNGDVVFYYGEITEVMLRLFRDFIENTSSTDPKYESLYFFLKTPGGSVETAEKMVDIIRHHYKKVFFVVPDGVYSAGTILCMSGDGIYMDYSSFLGPIDPQVWNGEQWVPALGYLDKVEEMLWKAKNNELTDAEFVILQNQDLALLSRYEQAKDLTETLLKKWLVEFKFKDWKVHSSNGKDVTLDEKEERASNVAELLGDNQMWHSHGRMISISTLQDVIRLKIDDYSCDENLRPKIRDYNDMLTGYIGRIGLQYYLHSKII